MHRISVDQETGQFDNDKIQSGISYSQHELMRGIVEIIKTLDTDDGAKIEDVLPALEQAGIERGRAESSIEKLKEKKFYF